MESRLRVAGHPVQPMLVMFPLGLFASAVIFDAAYLLGAPELVGQVAYWNIVAGLFGGVCAGAAGFIDLVTTANGTRAKRVAVGHALINFGVLLFFTVILMVRMGAADRGVGGGLFVVELLGLAGAAVGAWFGGELIDRLGARADAAADLEASGALPETGAGGLGSLGGVR